MASARRSALQLLVGARLLLSVEAIRIALPAEPPLPEVDVSRQHLSLEERYGDEPVFIDTVVDESRTHAYVLFTTKVLKHKGKAYGRLASAQWSCRWPSGNLLVPDGSTAGIGLAESGARRAAADGGAPNGSRASVGLAESKAQQETVTSGAAVHAVEFLAQMDPHLHSLVIRCELPFPGARHPVLAVTATNLSDGETVYSRKDLPVRHRPVFAESSSALCTMVIRDSPATPYLEKWARYHVNLGFDQIVVYVEDEDLDWARRALAELIQKGKVRLVHFWFGELSKRRNFYLQQAQEQHCLYHAKGRVGWLGHNDIDEYFDIVDGKNLNDFLPGKEVGIGAVSVMSQFWSYSESHVPSDADSPPCDMTCKSAGYIKIGRRKLIMDTRRVRYYSVHEPTNYSGSLYTYDPTTKIRLNHFKALLGHHWGKECHQDETFRARCLALSSAK